MDVQSAPVLYSALALAIVACLMSSWLIYSHLTHFTQPRVQNKIVGIIYMVPIYSLDSYLGLLWPSYALFINMFRDCYEAYVLYLFLSLMLGYLGAEEDDSAVAVYLESHVFSEAEALLPHGSTGPAPKTQSSSYSVARGRQFLRRCKFGVLQYCLVRPFCAVLALFAHLLHAYDESNLSPYNVYPYCLVLLNVSVFFAFYMLAEFFHALYRPLKPFKPVGKFLCIKFVLFFAFWQSVVLSVLAQYHYLSTESSTAVQNLLILVEMAAVSCFHVFTFSARPFFPGVEQDSDDANEEAAGRRLEAGRYGRLTQYIPESGEGPQMSFDMETQEGEGRRKGGRAYRVLSETLDVHFSAKSAVRDFNESMPVLSLPTGFTSKQGRVVRSNPSHRLSSVSTASGDGTL